MQFCWSTYLLQCNSEAVPDAAFIQVEKSLASGIQPLQTVEILQKAKVPLDYFTDIVKQRSAGKSHILQEDTKSSSSLLQSQQEFKSILTNSKQIFTSSGTCSIEKSYKYVSVTTYWIAQVTTVCGPLLRVRYVLPTAYSGFEFWVQVGSDELKHIGYGIKNGLIPALPASAVPCAEGETSAFKRDIKNEQDVGHISINSADLKLNFNYSSNFFRGTATDVLVFISYITSCYVPVVKEALRESTRPYFKRIEPGQYVEVLNNSSSKRGWPAIVLQNVGGRLLLRHVCSAGAGQRVGRDGAPYPSANNREMQGQGSGKETVVTSNSTSTQDASRSTIKTDSSSSVTIIDSKSRFIKDAPNNIIMQDTRCCTPLLDNRCIVAMKDRTNSALLPELPAQGVTTTSKQDDISSTSIQDINSYTSMKDTTSRNSMQGITSSMLKEDSPSLTSTENIICSSSKEGKTLSMTTQGSSITSTQDSTSSCPTLSTSCNKTSLETPSSTVIQYSSSNMAVDDISSSNTTCDTSMGTKGTDDIPPCSAPLVASSGSALSQDVLDNDTVDTLVYQGQCLGSEASRKPSSDALHVDDANSDLACDMVTHKASASKGEGQNSSFSKIEGWDTSFGKGESLDNSESKGEDQDTSANKDVQNIWANKEVQNISANKEDQDTSVSKREGHIVSVSKGEGQETSVSKGDDRDTSVSKKGQDTSSSQEGQDTSSSQEGQDTSSIQEGQDTSSSQEGQDSSSSQDDVQCASGCSEVTKDSFPGTTLTQEELDCRRMDHDGSSRMTDAELTFPRSNGATNTSVISTAKNKVSDCIEESEEVFVNSESTHIEPFRIKPMQDSSADSCVTLCSSLNNKASHTALTNTSQSELSSASNQCLQEKADQCMATYFDITRTSDGLKNKPIETTSTGCSSCESNLNSVSSDPRVSSVCTAVIAKEASSSRTSDDGNFGTASFAVPKVPDTLSCCPSRYVEASFLKEFWLFCTNERLRNVGWSSSPGRQCCRHQFPSDKTVIESPSCVLLECMARAVSVPLPVGGNPKIDEYQSPQGWMPQDADSSKPKASVSDKVEKIEVDGTGKNEESSVPDDDYGKKKLQALASYKFDKMEVDCTLKDKDGSIPSDGNVKGNVSTNNSDKFLNSIFRVVENDSQVISKVGLLTHKIKPDMVLEIIHPRRLCCVHAAIVTRVWSEYQIEVRFDACENDGALVAAGNPGNEEWRDTGVVLPSCNSSCQQRDLNEANLIVEDLVFDEVSLQWKWKIHVWDYHILPAGFCSQHNIPLHPLLEVECQSNTTEAVETVITSYTMVTNDASDTELTFASNPEVEKEICCSNSNEERAWTFSSQCDGKESSLRSEHPLDFSSDPSSISRQYPSESQSPNTKERDNTSHYYTPSVPEDCPTENIIDIKPDQSLIKIEANELMQGSINEIVNIEVEIEEKIPNNVAALIASSIKTDFVVDETVSATTLNNNIVSSDEDQMDEVTLLVDDSLLCGVGEPKQSDGDAKRRRCAGDPNAAFSWKCSPWRSRPAFKKTVLCPMAVELGFSEHQKLETVHPRHPSMLCVATIVAITGHLLWIRIDSKEDVLLVSAPEEDKEAYLPADGGSSEHILFHISCSCQKSVVVVRPCNSDEIFPAGWAQSHDAMFRIPRGCWPTDYETDQESLRAIISPPLLQPPGPSLDDLASSSRWCPQLHLHHTCCPGPFLSRTKLACQPGLAVAGPVPSVLVQVVAQSLAAGFCPTKLTKDLAAALQRVARPDWALMDIKAKCKRYSVRGTVLAPAVRRDVPAFLDQLRAVLQCCPNLWSHTKRAVCPHHCKQPAPALASTGGRRRAALPSSVSLLGATCQPGDEDLEEEDDDGEDDPIPAAEWGDEGGADPCEDEADTSWLRSNMRSGDASLKRARSESAVPGTTDGSSKKRKASRSGAIQPADVENDPLTWSVNDVYEFVSKEPSVCHHASWLRRERVDGRALLLLNLATLVHQLRLPHRALLPLAHLLCRLKMAHLLKRGVE